MGEYLREQYTKKEETMFKPTEGDKNIVKEILYRNCIPKTHGQTADEIATEMLTRLHERNRLVMEQATRAEEVNKMKVKDLF